MVLHIKSAVGTRAIMFHADDYNKKSQNLKVSPEGEGFKPIEGIITFIQLDFATKRGELLMLILQNFLAKILIID